jgi:tRNA dimethylallyltransferase
MVKIIVIVGPTASGKSDLAVKLAKKFNGEVISADSRQVYRGMDIGSGKVPRDKIRNRGYFYKGVCHHLLDVASPRKTFSVARYQRLALRAIQDIAQRGKIPIICGGTGFYIESLINGLRLPNVKPDPSLRKQLEKKNAPELFAMLKATDPERAKSIDPKNKRRLIRALEIIAAIGRVPPQKWQPLPHPILMIGISKNSETLKKLIEKRFFQRIKQGMLKEIARLHQPEIGCGISWQRLESLGLEYRYGAMLLQNKISNQEFIEKTLRAIYQYAKKQMTWFKKDKRINWIKNVSQAEKLVKRFLKNKDPLKRGY